MNRLAQSLTLKEPHVQVRVLTVSLVSAFLWIQPIAAQIVPDTTLPAGERSQVTGNPNFQLDGGAVRGSNLFHSFSEFSIPTGGSAFFNNAVDVQNILTRVTGQSISNIDGLIRANGTANLFLINPNGIIFGPNASLNIGGSFVGSTASSIQFADGTEFSAVNPSAAPLLTISVPIGLQFNGRQGDIVMQGTPVKPFNEVGDAGQLLDTAQTVGNAPYGTSFNAIAGSLNSGNDVDLYQLNLTQGVPFQVTTVNGTNVDTKLFLFDSRGLGLSSNDDSTNTRQSTLPLNQPFIPAVSGTYYLGISNFALNPLSSGGRIFSPSGEPNGLGAGFPLSGWTTTRITDYGPYVINLTPQSYFQVQPGRTLALVGGNVTLERSNLQALGGRVELGGVASSGSVGLNVSGDRINLSFPNQIARADVTLKNSGIDVRGANGNMSLVARNIDISGSSLRAEIPSNSRLPATQTGDLELNATGSLTMSKSILTNNLFGQGTMGNINLTAGDRISLDSSSVSNTLEQTGVGKIGDINITTESLSLTNNARLISLTAGRGDAGRININARNTVSLDRSSLTNTVDRSGIGNGGDINITTGSLALTDYALLTTSMNGQGNAGSVTIHARDAVSLNGGFLTSALRGIGNPGNINITTGSLSLAVGSQVSSYTDGRGNAGSVNIQARDTVSLDNYSGMFNNILSDATGTSGGINITTGSLLLTNRSFLLSNTEGRGNAGSVNIQARDTVLLDGTPGRSLISTDVAGLASGQGGDITIKTGSLFLINGGVITTQNFSGIGNAGRVTIEARDAVHIRGRVPKSRDASSLSQVATSVTTSSVVENQTAGNAGDVSITTGSLSVADEGRIATNADGRGNAGSIRIQASDTVSFDRGEAISTLDREGVGRGGDIGIEARSLSVLNGAQLATSTSGQGDAGSVNINARDRVSVDGESANGTLTSTISTQVNSGATGRGGDVTIATGSLSLTNGGAVNTANLGGSGDAGRVIIQARDAVQIRGTASTQTNRRSGVTTSAEARSVGSGGDVSITTGSLTVSEQGIINTNAQAQGNAGNIQIWASDAVSFDGGDAISTLDAGAVGRGGNIDMAARSLSVLNGAQLAASTAGAGPAGNITVSADTVGLSQGGRLLTTTSSHSRAGDITVNTPELQLSGASSGLLAGTTSAGDAGNLTIQPRGNGRVRVNLQGGAQISASTSSSGRGGTLTIAAPDSVTLTGKGSIIAAETGGSGTGGNLNIRTGDLSIQNQAEVTVSSSGTGTAGNLFVDADRIYLNNGGRIRADTSGGGGNINVRSPLILLRNGSNITTNAQGTNIPGGNISIDTRFLIAVLNENSNISANSEDFRGGNVSINAFSIFGIQPSLVSTPLSDITATGATSALPGTLDITTAGIDPASGLVPLPTDLVDASRLIAQGCPADRGNSFVITGRGGLPPTPDQELEDAVEWHDRSILGVAQQVNRDRSVRTQTSDRHTEASPPRVVPQVTTVASIIEATGWQRTATGEVILIAKTPDPTLQNSLYQSVVCHGRR